MLSPRQGRVAKYSNPPKPSTNIQTIILVPSNRKRAKKRATEYKRRIQSRMQQRIKSGPATLPKPAALTARVKGFERASDLSKLR